MEFGKDVEDRYSAGDLQNMFYKDDNEDGSKLLFNQFHDFALLYCFLFEIWLVWRSNRQ